MFSSPSSSFVCCFDGKTPSGDRVEVEVGFDNIGSGRVPDRGAAMWSLLSFDHPRDDVIKDEFYTRRLVLQ